MPRSLSTSLINAGALELTLAIFVQATLATSTVYFWSRLGLINYNGQTWRGPGRSGSVAIAVGTRMESGSLNLKLSRFDTTLPLAEFKPHAGDRLPGLFSSGALIA